MSLSEDFLTVSPSWRDYVHRNVTRIFHAVLEKDPAILHEIMDVPMFSVLQTTIIAHDKTEYSLSLFFDYLVDQYDFGGSTPPAVLEMAFYLSSARRADLESVVEHVLSVLTLYARPHTADELPSTVASHPALARDDVIHPTIPFLLFIKDLSALSEDAAHLFVKQGVVDVIGDLCAKNIPDPGRDPPGYRDFVPSATRLTCCILLVDIYAVFPGLVRHLRLTNPNGFFDIFPWMVDYSQVQAIEESHMELLTEEIQNSFYDQLFDLYHISYVFL